MRGALPWNGARDIEARYLVSVITATTGNSKLRRAIDSVQEQTYPHIEHVIVIDGPAGAESVRNMLPRDASHAIHVISLPFNTGADGYLGHGIYGACVYLVNGRYVAFLDDDNWFEPHHVANLMELIESKGLEWSYSLRNIVDANGNLITQDNCESLGRWPIWNTAGRHLVDINCYLLRRDIAIGTSPTFHRRFRDQENPDYRLCRFLLDNATCFETNGDYTVNYTAGNTSKSVAADHLSPGIR
jgi:glycosyltransferase involved in cell wall biosynthesis